VRGQSGLREDLLPAQALPRPSGRHQADLD
jgi:hypothetical protein